MFDDIQIPRELIPSDPRFTSGPSLVPVIHLENLAKTKTSLMGTSHRKPAIKNLVANISSGLLEYFKTPSDYSVVMGNGGATLLFDMIGLGAVLKKSCHYTCGEFSNKWFKSHQAIPWIDAQELAQDYGQGTSVAHIPEVDVTCATLNETSTGVCLDSLPEKSAWSLMCIDATSGAGQVRCDLSQSDLFFFSPQKVFASDGGLWVSILSPQARERLLKVAQDKNRYIPKMMDWKVAIENADKDQTYNTPSVATLFLLNEQIKKMNQIGYGKVVELADKKAQLIYSWAEEKPYLKPYVENKKFRSNAVATIDVDDKTPVSELISKLSQDQVAIGIDPYRKLGRNQLRIALFHNILYEDVEKLTQLISFLIEKKL